MKTTKQQKGIYMPQQTLQAIKNLLFSQEGDDLSNLLLDLSFGKQNPLIAINVALIHKGTKIEIDQAPRFSHICGKRFYRYAYLGHSLIKGEILCHCTECKIADETGDIKTLQDRGEQTLSFEQWDTFATNVKDLIIDF
jgi:hypothetical protein